MRVLTFDFNSNFELTKQGGEYYIEGYGKSYMCSPSFQPVNPDSAPLSSINKMKIIKEMKDREPEIASDCGLGAKKLPKASKSQQPTATGGTTEMTMDLTNAIKEAVTEGIKAGRDYNPYEQAIVESIVEKGQQISVDDILEGAKSKIDAFIKSEYGNLPQKVAVTVNDIPKGETSGLFHSEFEKILKFVANNIPVFLVGPAGSGKNHTLEQVAEALELDFYFTNAVTQEYKLTGFIDANGKYHETEFYKAFTKGGLFFLDEMDASIPEVLIMLNASIANRYFDFPNGRVNAHKDFRVVSAGNTVGNGSSMDYSGRSQLDGATLDRFALIEFTYDPRVEKQLAGDEELYKFITSLRTAIEKKNVQFIVSMRATQNAHKMMECLSIDEVIKHVILKSMPADDMKILLGDVANGPWKTAMKELINQSSY